MKTQTAIKSIAILIISLFLAGTTQIGLSSSINDTELNPQTAETRTAFDPFMDGWAYRKQITIDNTNVASDLTDFPVFISITDSNLQTKAQSDGDDILFMDGTGIAQQLNHEIENYDSSTGEFVAWVNIPSVSATTDTIFYMYYGNPECNSQQHVEDTWNSNFMAVWHLQGNPTQTILDSTINHNDGTSFGSMTSSDVVDGKVGKCLEFDGINDYVSVPDSASLDPVDVTLVTWYKPKDNGLYYGDFLGKNCFDTWGNADGRTYGFGVNDAGHYIRGVFESDTYQQYDNVGNEPIVVDTWFYLALTFNDVTREGVCYVNGAVNGIKNPCDSTVLWHNDPWAFAMGGCGYALGSQQIIDRFYNCVLDEVRVLNTPLSAGWISTEYNNQNSPMTFLTFGSEEPIPFVKTIMFGKITNLNTGINSITFNAVKLRCIRFSPFSFNTYSSNEGMLVSTQYRGFISQTRVLAICQAYP